MPANVSNKNISLCLSGNESMAESPIKADFEGIVENLLVCTIIGFVLLVIGKIAFGSLTELGHIGLMNSANANKVYIERKGIFPLEGLVEEGSYTKSNYMFFFVHVLIKIRSHHILEKCGMNGYNYIKFQQYLIFTSFIVTLMAMAIVLPVHLSGKRLHRFSYYGRTTIDNIFLQSDITWFHFIMSILLFPILFILRRRFLKMITPEVMEEVETLNILFVGPPKTTNAEEIRAICKRIIPHGVLQQIDMPYESMIIENSLLLERATMAKEWCMKQKAKTGKDVRISPITCRIYCTCSICCRIDGLQFYKQEEKKYVQKLHDSLMEELDRGAICFKFRTLKETMAVFNHFENVSFITNFKSLFCGRIRVYMIPDLNDMIWENINHKYFNWYFRFVVINGGLSFMFLFFTTPIIMLKTVGRKDGHIAPFWADIKRMHPIFSFWLLKIGSSFMLFILGFFIPVFVYMSEGYQKHWRHSVFCEFILTKYYWFLLFMCFILPVVGTEAFITMLKVLSGISTSRKHILCLREVNVGAAYVNLFINLGVMYGAFYLARIYDLYLYLLHLTKARCRAEKPFIDKSTKFCFEYSFKYAWNIFVYTIMISLCFAAPLIAPAGLAYQVIMYYVDLYNLFYAEVHFEGSIHLHDIPCKYFLFAAVCNQAFLVMYMYAREADTETISLLGFTTLVSFGLYCIEVFGWCDFLKQIVLTGSRNKKNPWTALLPQDRRPISIPLNRHIGNQSRNQPMSFPAPMQVFETSQPSSNLQV